MCRSGCASQDHESWGACARAAGIQIDKHALKHGDIDRRKDKTLARYVRMRELGAQPLNTTKTAVDVCEQASDATGTPFRADKITADSLNPEKLAA